MPILPALIIVEILSVFLISSANPYTISKLKHNIAKAVPQVFAEDATSSADTSTPAPDNSSSTPPQDNSTNTSQPSDQTTSAPTDQTAPTEQSPTATEVPQSTNNDQSQATPSEVNNSQTNNATPSSSESPVSPPSVSESESQTQPVVLDESQQQAQAASQTVITGNDMISGPVENIDKNVEEQSAMQDDKLEQAKTPEEKASLSVDFANQSVKATEQSLKNDDIQTTAFVVQRISDQIDTAVSSAQLSSNTKALEQVSSFCKQADLIFRTQQLSVPEEAAQDFEIVRGKCLNVTQ